MADVVVIGGGVIGLSVAWKLAASGAVVTVCDPAPGAGASWAAAGMLAPVTESRIGEPALTELCLASLREWPDFARGLEDFSGCPVGLRTEGTLAVGLDEDDRRALQHLASVHSRLGLQSSPLSGRECRRLEPLLSPRVTGGLDIPGDHQVDNRLLVTALQQACA
ncbi:MAG TPA: FAD-dependent oxidoreductase, partial [Acidimicrobiales bacterium]|nr:FAD-dependent oxidoreductase [Acidimicrobiales bacterium]